MEKELLKAALNDCVAITRKNIKVFKDKFPNACSEDQLYKAIDNTHWTNGFYTGILWLCYEYTKEEIFKETALEHVKSFKNRLDNNIELETHDLGFLYSLSCVAGYKLTGDETSKTAALQAADLLKRRYREKGGFIQAWGPLDAKDNYRLIIDCLLNLPLLYWAAEVTGDQSYYQTAYTHAQTALKYVIREDHSTFHTYFFDKETGEPSHGATCQGYNDISAWARGQAWGIYGTALSYTFTKDPKFIEDFFKVTQYFEQNLPTDFVPYWDLIFKEGDEPRDSSAAAIAICGIDEMKKYLTGIQEIEELGSFSEKMMESLIQNYSAKPEDKTHGFIYHSTYSKKTPYNTCTPEGVDECVIWGDYFYMEALMRGLDKTWQMYW
jgi:unsaturated chondroitin disaccharide hydrolase